MAREHLVEALPPRWRNEVDAETLRAVTAEFSGTLLFMFLATVGAGTALQIGVAYAVSSYAVAAVSGGHLNPAVSLSFALSGHQHAALSGLYVIAQILGGIVAALLECILLPGVRIGHHKGFHPSGWLPHTLHHTGWFATIIWEFVLTFVLLAVAYGTMVGAKRFTVVAPLAIGLAIFAAKEAGGMYTGALMNPVSLIAPAIIFLAGWKKIWFYVLGQLLAVGVASAWAATTFGTGPAYAENREELYGRAGGHLTEGLMPSETNP